MTAQTPDRFKADRPVPKPGIVEIEAYKPGKAALSVLQHVKA